MVDLASDHLHLRHSEACFLGYLTGRARARAHTNFWWFSGLNLGLQYSSAAASGHLHHGDPGRRRQSLPTNQPNATFMQRLWCLFELAAFLHSREAGTKTRLTIRPTLLGPLFLITVFSLIIFNAVTTFAWVLIESFWYFWLVVLLLSSVNFWLTAHMGRGYCRTIERVRDEIAEFSVDKLVSWCCCVGHKDPASGVRLTCDRKIILQCIQIWFGTVNAFENRVQTEIVRILVDQLSNQVYRGGTGSPG